ncbi:dimer_Tnp_hAT domain-containing protein [Trichonephila clavipes]|nr:dimer_Tnp_hAT domain-containing protein [Trichonephila clavipes]
MASILLKKRRKLEFIKTERLTSNISKKASHEILETWDSIPDAFSCLKRLAHAISIYLRLRLIIFRDENNIKDSLRNHLEDDSNSACTLVKVTSYNPNTSYLSSNLPQQNFH